MNRSLTSNANILIASENASNAVLVKELLEADFDNIFTTTDPDQATVDFDRHQPDVLLLVFETLEKAQRYYLGLYRSGCTAQLHPHRTVVLSSRGQVKHAYQLCREGIFDDYILFWPMTEDVTRLPMSVFLALRELAGAAASSPAAADFAAQVKRLATLEKMLAEQLAQGGVQMDSIEQAVACARSNASSALEVFSQQLVQGGFQELVAVKNADGLQHELGHLKRETVEVPLQNLTQSMHSLRQWSDEFREAGDSYLGPIRTLNTMAGTVPSTLLVVDDDEFQHKIIDSVLKEENYRLLFATKGSEAFKILRNIRPDLILMDVIMPDMNGVEVMRQIKTIPRLAEIPVLMITGKSEKGTVMEILDAGANGIIVKPIVRDTLLERVKQILLR